MEGKKRVEAFLRENSVEHEFFDFSLSTHDAESAARALGVSVGQVAKSVVLVADGSPLVVIVPGDRKVSYRKVKKALSLKKVRMARPDEVERETGFAVGAVSPFGLPDGVRVFVDESVLKYEEIYPAGGEVNVMCRVGVEEMLRVLGADTADLSDPIEEESL